MFEESENARIRSNDMKRYGVAKKVSCDFSTHTVSNTKSMRVA
jgi:hypothetical protein